MVSSPVVAMNKDRRARTRARPRVHQRGLSGDEKARGG
jgi:hypothetical protein